MWEGEIEKNVMHWPGIEPTTFALLWKALTSHPITGRISSNKNFYEIYCFIILFYLFYYFEFKASWRSWIMYTAMLDLGLMANKLIYSYFDEFRIIDVSETKEWPLSRMCVRPCACWYNPMIINVTTETFSISSGMGWAATLRIFDVRNILLVVGTLSDFEDEDLRNYQESNPKIHRTGDRE